MHCNTDGRRSDERPNLHRNYNWEVRLAGDRGVAQLHPPICRSGKIKYCSVEHGCIGTGMCHQAFSGEQLSFHLQARYRRAVSALAAGYAWVLAL